MSLKLSQLKNWLTLEDSAKYISLLIGEEASAADLLQLALQGDLTLSINLVNRYPSQLGPLLTVQEATLYRTTMLNDLTAPEGTIEELKGDEKQVVLDALLTATQQKSHSTTATTDGGVTVKSRKNTLNNPKPKYAVYFKGDLLPDFTGVIEFDREVIQKIAGLWDLSMVGSEALEIENIFYDDIGGPSIDSIKLCGIILKHPSKNQWANLVEYFTDKAKKIEPKDYYPKEELPEREPIVIRRSELERFANSLTEPEPKTNAPSDQVKFLPEDFSALYEAIGADELPHMDILVTAWRKFWKGRSSNDGKPYEKNADVANWIKKQMESPSTVLAENMAKIIRPAWAPAGRQPNRNKQKANPDQAANSGASRKGSPL